jgi:hypothetical protein
VRVEPIRAFTVICLVFAPTFAAAEMPRHDVEAHCTEVAGFGGEYSAMMYDGCFDMEQGAYDNLKARWDALPGSMRNHCNEIATFGGPGSYAMLEGCVQMEEQAVGTDNTFQH